MEVLSSLSIPYRYDLGPGGDHNISYFIDNGFRQSFGGVQNSGSTLHENLNLSDTYPRVCRKCFGEIYPQSSDALVLLF